MIAKGQRYDAPTMGCTLDVRRVARDGTWADIKVTRISATDGTGQPWKIATWTKRQLLRTDVEFPFPTVLLGGEL